MADSQHHHNRKLHSEQASEEIRADELIKATQIEAKDHGKGADEPLKNIPVTNSNYWRFRGEKHSSLPKGLTWGITGLVVLFIGGSIVSYYIVKKSVANTLSSRVDTLQEGVHDLQNLDPKSAQVKFDSLNSAISSPSGFFGAMTSLFQGGSGAIRSFGDLSKQLALLTQDMSNAERDLFSQGSATSQSSSTLVNDLKQIRAELGAIDVDSNQLSGAATYLGSGSSLSGEGYLSLKAQIQGAEHFLDAFVPWLADGSTHHMLVLLENPSEMRPGGGFLGSYADISITARR